MNTSKEARADRKKPNSRMMIRAMAASRPRAMPRAWPVVAILARPSGNETKKVLCHSGRCLLLRQGLLLLGFYCAKWHSELKNVGQAVDRLRSLSGN